MTSSSRMWNGPLDAEEAQILLEARQHAEEIRRERPAGPAFQSLMASARAGKWPPTPLQIEWLARENGKDPAYAKQIANEYAKGAFPVQSAASDEARALIAALRSFRVEA